MRKCHKDTSVSDADALDRDTAERDGEKITEMICSQKDVLRRDNN